VLAFGRWQLGVSGERSSVEAGIIVVPNRGIEMFTNRPRSSTEARPGSVADAARLAVLLPSLLGAGSAVAEGDLPLPPIDSPTSAPLVHQPDINPDNNIKHGIEPDRIEPDRIESDSRPWREVILECLAVSQKVPQHVIDELMAEVVVGDLFSRLVHIRGDGGIGVISETSFYDLPAEMEDLLLHGPVSKGWGELLQAGLENDNAVLISATVDARVISQNGFVTSQVRTEPHQPSRVLRSGFWNMSPGDDAAVDDRGSRTSFIIQLAPEPNADFLGDQVDKILSQDDPTEKLGALLRLDRNHLGGNPRVHTRFGAFFPVNTDPFANLGCFAFGCLDRFKFGDLPSTLVHLPSPPAPGTPMILRQVGEGLIEVREPADRFTMVIDIRGEEPRIVAQCVYVLPGFREERKEAVAHARPELEAQDDSELKKVQLEWLDRNFGDQFDQAAFFRVLSRVKFIDDRRRITRIAVSRGLPDPFDRDRGDFTRDQAKAIWTGCLTPELRERLKQQSLLIFKDSPDDSKPQRPWEGGDFDVEATRAWRDSLMPDMREGLDKWVAEIEETAISASIQAERLQSVRVIEWGDNGRPIGVTHLRRLTEQDPDGEMQVRLRAFRITFPVWEFYRDIREVFIPPEDWDEEIKNKFRREPGVG